MSQNFFSQQGYSSFGSSSSCSQTCHTGGSSDDTDEDNDNNISYGSRGDGGYNHDQRDKRRQQTIVFVFVLNQNQDKSGGKNGDKSSSYPLFPDLSCDYPNARIDLDYLAEHLPRMPKYNSRLILKRISKSPQELDQFLYSIGCTYGQHTRSVSPELSLDLDVYSQPSQSPPSSQKVPSRGAAFNAATNTTYCFVINYFESRLFDRLIVESHIKVVSPLTIQYWRKLFDRQQQSFDFDHRLEKARMGLYSECFDDTVVYLSRAFPERDRSIFATMIRWMGGVVVEKFTIDVTHVVIEPLVGGAVNVGSKDAAVNVAFNFGYNVFTHELIEMAWTPLQMQKEFVTLQMIMNKSAAHRFAYGVLQQNPILADKVIGMVDKVCLANSAKRNTINKRLDRVIEGVIRYGGHIVKSVQEYSRYHKIDVILHIEPPASLKSSNNQEILDRYRNDTEFSRYQEQHRMQSDCPLPIVSVSWLFDSLINGQLKPIDEYLIKTSSSSTSCSSSYWLENEQNNRFHYGGSTTTKYDEMMLDSPMSNDALSWIDEEPPASQQNFNQELMIELDRTSMNSGGSGRRRMNQRTSSTDHHHHHHGTKNLDVRQKYK